MQPRSAQETSSARCCGVQEVLTEESLAQKQKAPQAEQLDLVIMFATGGGVRVARRRPTLYRVLIFWRVHPLAHLPAGCRKSKWAKSRSVLIETSRPPRGISPPPTADAAPSCQDWFAAGNGRNAIHHQCLISCYDSKRGNMFLSINLVERARSWNLLLVKFFCIFAHF